MPRTRELRIMLNLDKPEHAKLNFYLDGSIPKGQQSEVLREIIMAHFEKRPVPDFPPFYFPSKQQPAAIGLPVAVMQEPTFLLQGNPCTPATHGAPAPTPRQIASTEDPEFKRDWQPTSATDEAPVCHLDAAVLASEAPIPAAQHRKRLVF